MCMSPLYPTSSGITEQCPRLFIDQPVGTGFSYGTRNVDSSELAAVDVWKFLQIWFADPRFHKYAHRDFGIWTESYGGHYGPTFAACVSVALSHDAVVFLSLTSNFCSYFLQQNAAIRFGTVKGVTINLKVLGIGNGLTVRRSGMPRWPTCC
jgi:carboxypeptidase C (cathepsin A)